MLKMRLITSCVLGLVAGALASGSNATNSSCIGIEAIKPSCQTRQSLHYRDYFYVGGRYVDSALGNLTYDQMYVEKLTPAGGVKQSMPVVFFHGGGVTGATWLNTPDNRPGFATYFLARGYQVYLVDQTSVGRGTEENLDAFSMRIGSTAEITEEGFTAPEVSDAYPQSVNHTQWPGTGLRGDAAFDAFEAGFVPLTDNMTAQELSMRASGCALLELVGKAFLVSHSIGALFPILLSNDCPALVAGNINLEPGNIPFQDYIGNTTVPIVGRTADHAWGLTYTRVDYEPAVANYTDLALAVVGDDTPGNRSCLMQATNGTIHTLPKIASVPYVALTGSASPHITYDHCTIAYLQQVGGSPDWIRLGDRGIVGNGHFGYLELNNGEIAAVVLEWMANQTQRMR